MYRESSQVLNFLLSGLEVREGEKERGFRNDENVVADRAQVLLYTTPTPRAKAHTHRNHNKLESEELFCTGWVRLCSDWLI